MNEHLPADSDGDALRRLLATGSDLSKEMVIDFAVDVPDSETGHKFAALAQLRGFQTKVDQDDTSGHWTCYCTKAMIPVFADIVGIQNDFEELGRPLNARPDGWGSFGNGE